MRPDNPLRNNSSAIRKTAEYSSSPSASLGINFVEKFSTRPFGPRSNDIGARVRSNNIAVGLGHRRLAIIDLSEAGHQPMSNEDGSIWIVLNGEIYNFVEMSDNCVNRGYFKKEAVKKLLDEHVACKANNGART